MDNLALLAIRQHLSELRQDNQLLAQAMLRIISRQEQFEAKMSAEIEAVIAATNESIKRVLDRMAMILSESQDRATAVAERDRALEDLKAVSADRDALRSALETLKTQMDSVVPVPQP